MDLRRVTNQCNSVLSYLNEAISDLTRTRLSSKNVSTIKEL